MMKLESLEKEHYYHIYNRGINGTTIFAGDENKRYFLALMKKYLSNNVSVFAYCLLGNHFHLVVKIDSDEKKVTQQFSNLFNAYAKAFNKMYSRTGSLFEKHFKRIKLHNDDYLRQVIIYTHLNPKNHYNLDYETYE
ncbi:MAG: transposase [Gillisia sp.]